MITTILMIVNVFAAVAIIVLVLMQQSKGDMGSAFGGGGSQSMFGSRGSANFLSRLTSIMCAVFFISAIALAYVYKTARDEAGVIENTSVLDVAPAEDSTAVPAIETDSQEGVPQVPSADQLQVPNEAAPIENAVEEAAPAVDQAQEGVPQVPTGN
jgi:preprotein translocase subunit SecG